MKISFLLPLACLLLLSSTVSGRRGKGKGKGKGKEPTASKIGFDLKLKKIYIFVLKDNYTRKFKKFSS